MAPTPRASTRRRSRRMLASAVRDEKFDLVLTGLQSDDQGFGQVGVILAEALGMPHATIIMEVQVERRRRSASSASSKAGGSSGSTLPLPALLTIQSGINQLRYATLKGIMAAKKKEIRKVAPAAAAGAAAADPARVRSREGQEDADDCRFGRPRPRRRSSAAFVTMRG